MCRQRCSPQPPILRRATAGQGLTFQLPVANGSYTLTLYFADPSANAAAQRVFNIVANGETLEANYDVFAAAKAQYGNGNHAVSLSFPVTVTGGEGLALDFVNAAGLRRTGQRYRARAGECRRHRFAHRHRRRCPPMAARRGRRSPRACRSTRTVKASTSGQ